MPFSSGVYTLPNPALVTGEVVSATENNTTRNDLAGALNLTMLRNGTSTATANLPMGGYKLTGLGAPSTNGDSLAYGAAAVVTTLTSTSLTATRVPYAGTGGLLQDASTFTFDGTTLTAGGFTTSGAISAGTITASGAVTVSGGTANGVAYLNGSKVLTTGSALTFDGTNGGTTGNWTAGNLASVSGGYVRVNRADNATYNEIKYAAGDLFYFNQANGGAYQFNISGSEQMRLTSTGLGIGTSSPATKLHVQADDTNTIARQLTISGATSSNKRLYIGFNTSTNVGTIQAYEEAFGKRDLVLQPDSGNLGLGVTPSAWGNFRAFDIGSYGSIFTTGSRSVDFGVNTYINSSNSYTYKNTGYATRYEQYDGTHQWFTAPSGTAGNAISFTQAMTLDASGNLGIGTSSPNYKLTLGGQTGSQAYPIALRFADDYSSTQTATGCKVFLYNDGSTGNKFGFGVGAYSDVQYHAGSTGASTGNHRWYTNDTERMRIDSSGNLIQAASADNPRIYSQGVYNVTGASAANVVIDSSGGMFRSTSSIKYKKNVVDADYGLDDVLNLRPVIYESKNESEAGRKFGGLIAEEVAAAGLEMFIQYAEDGTPDALAYGNMVSLCIKAIQEQQEQINQLKAEVAALKNTAA